MMQKPSVDSSIRVDYFQMVSGKLIVISAGGGGNLKGGLPDSPELDGRFCLVDAGIFRCEEHGVLRICSFGEEAWASRFDRTGFIKIAT